MFEGWDAVVLARAQFAFTMSFHIVFPAFSIGLASYLAVLEALWLWTGREVFINLFNYWLKIFAVAFGMGVVSGIVMSYQFGTNWSVFADKTGPVIGPLMAYEVLTAFFLYVILGTTDTRAPRGFAPIAIGLSLTLIHLVSIPITNTSVNPARSIGPALFAGGDAIAQLWLFIVAPLAGAAIAGVTYALIVGGDDLVAPLQEATEA